MIALGIDPGTPGGAAVVEYRNGRFYLLAVASWGKDGRARRATVSWHGETLVWSVEDPPHSPYPLAVYWLTLGEAASVIACEAVSAHGTSSTGSLITLAERAGTAIGGAVCGAPEARVLRPVPATWRRVLGATGRADDLARLARAIVLDRPCAGFGPLPWRFAGPPPPEEIVSEHAAEAAMIAASAAREG